MSNLAKVIELNSMKRKNDEYYEIKCELQRINEIYSYRLENWFLSNEEKKELTEEYEQLKKELDYGTTEYIEKKKLVLKIFELYDSLGVEHIEFAGAMSRLTKDLKKAYEYYSVLW